VPTDLNALRLLALVGWPLFILLYLSTTAWSTNSKRKRTLEALQNLITYKLYKGAIFDPPPGIPRSIFDPLFGYPGEILIP
jgi:hypothetical protein